MIRDDHLYGRIEIEASSRTEAIRLFHGTSLLELYELCGKIETKAVLLEDGPLPADMPETATEDLPTDPAERQIVIFADFEQREVNARHRLLERLGVESNWSEFPGHPWQDWKSEVFNGDTMLGYWSWVAHRVLDELVEAETEDIPKEPTPP